MTRNNTFQNAHAMRMYTKHKYMNVCLRLPSHCTYRHTCAGMRKVLFTCIHINKTTNVEWVSISVLQYGWMALYLHVIEGV